MKQVAGVWLPDWEAHLVPFLEDRRHWVEGRGSYQLRKLTRAMGFARQRRRAIDVGAHVGLWSMQLVRLFESVVAFEPLRAHRDCFERNVDLERATVIPCALGAQRGAVRFRTGTGSSGDTWVVGPGMVPMRRLDEIGLDGHAVDFLKVDCEGYELFVLRGAERLLRRYKPVVVVEQKPGKARKFGLDDTEAVDFLTGLGATLRDEIGGDYILSW